VPADPKLHGNHATRERFDGMMQRLVTSDPLEKDMALLESGLLTDWRLRTILQFRVQRKQALWLSAIKLGTALNITFEGGGMAADADGNSSSQGEGRAP